MITSIERKTMDMEARDTNYFFQVYLLQYLFLSKNEDPVKVIVPKFPGFPHPRKPGVIIPIEWVEPDSPVAVEIAKDGSGIPAAEAPVPMEVIEKPTLAPEDIIKQEQESKGEPKQMSPAQAALAKRQRERIPKMPPGGDLGGGHADEIGSRDARFDSRIAMDLKPEAQVDESKEVETDIKKQ